MPGIARQSADRIVATAREARDLGIPAVALFPALPATPPTWAVVAALALSMAVGALFGVLPARRATRLDPVAALAGR